jgi:hypothetical protein
MLIVFISGLVAIVIVSISELKYPLSEMQLLSAKRQRFRNAWVEAISHLPYAQAPQMLRQNVVFVCKFWNILTGWRVSYRPTGSV